MWPVYYVIGTMLKVGMLKYSCLQMFRDMNPQQKYSGLISFL